MQRVKILKIPFEAGNPTGKKGPALAPNKLSELFPKIPKVDVDVNQSNIRESFKNIELVALKEFKAGNKVCAFGGDHSIAHPILKAASKVHKNLSLIYFDAHLDCEDYFSPPSHEDVIQAIVKDKIVKPENIIIVGARKWWKKEEQFIKKHNIKVIPPEEMDGFDVSKFVKGNIYISIDIDVFDPEVAPATNYPEKGGITVKKFQRFTRVLDFRRIIGFGIMEIAPCNENFENTVTVASYVTKFLL